MAALPFLLALQSFVIVQSAVVAVRRYPQLGQLVRDILRLLSSSAVDDTTRLFTLKYKIINNWRNETSTSLVVRSRLVPRLGPPDSGPCEIFHRMKNEVKSTRNCGRSGNVARVCVRVANAIVQPRNNNIDI